MNTAALLQDIPAPKKLSFVQQAKIIFERMRQIEQDNEGMLSTGQTMTVLNLSKQRVFQIVENGDLQTVLFEGKKYITGKSVQEYINIHLHGQGYKKPTAIQLLFSSMK
jgi:uncharacterized protein YlzI (FlbEa/FlbD family)